MGGIIIIVVFLVTFSEREVTSERISLPKEPRVEPLWELDAIILYMRATAIGLVCLGRYP